VLAAGILRFASRRPRFSRIRAGPVSAAANARFFTRPRNPALHPAARPICARKKAAICPQRLFVAFARAGDFLPPPGAPRFAAPRSRSTGNRWCDIARVAHPKRQVMISMVKIAVFHYRGAHIGALSDPPPENGGRLNRRKRRGFCVRLPSAKVK